MNNPIRLYRDADIRDSGKPFIPSGSLESELNAAYDKGIDQAIEVIDGYRKEGYNHHALGGIIQKLESLKNKP